MAWKSLNWSRTNAELDGSEFGHGKYSGSFYPVTKVGNTFIKLFGVWTDGKVEFLFRNQREVPPFDRDQYEDELLSGLHAISGVHIEPHPKYSKILLDLLADSDVGRPFLDVFEWVAHQMKAHRREGDES